MIRLIANIVAYLSPKKFINTMHQYRFIVLALLLLLTACTPTPPPDNTHSQQFYVFGTLVGITLWDVPEPKATEAIQAVIQRLQTLHNDWHAWEPSTVTALNQAIAEGQPFTLPKPELMPLLVKAQQYSQQSNGLFNPAIGKLIALWGFHQDEPPSGELPSTEHIAALLAEQPDMSALSWEELTVRSRNPAVQLDFGAFAKGYAVDQALDILKQQGIHNAIVNAGGNLKAMGSKGDVPWLVGIRNPSGEGVLAAIQTQGEESIITSGDYQRYREYQGQRYSHILDPRTGQPAQGFSSVTVIHSEGALADAAATAISVAGLEEWSNIAQQMGVDQVMLVETDGKITVTQTLATRIEFQRKQKDIYLHDEF